MQNSKEVTVSKTTTGVLRRSPSQGKDPNPVDGKLEAPRINQLSLISLFQNKEITIYSPKDSFLTQVYNQNPSKEKDPFGIFTATLLDVHFGESGEPLFALVSYKVRGARKWRQIDLLPLHGCSLSLSVETEQDDETDSDPTPAN